MDIIDIVDIVDIVDITDIVDISTLLAAIMVWLMAPSSSQDSSLMWDTHSRNSLGPCRCRYAGMQVCGYLKA